MLHAIYSYDNKAELSASLLLVLEKHFLLLSMLKKNKTFFLNVIFYQSHVLQG